MLETVLHVVGARPNLVKVAPLMREMSKMPERFRQVLVHTGQHYDDTMSRIFFQDLAIPDPDVNLDVGSGSQASQTANIMLRLEQALLEYRPDLVVVYGDANSTLAAALTAAKLELPVAHVEAGLRFTVFKVPHAVAHFEPNIPKKGQKSAYGRIDTVLVIRVIQQNH